jgi:hypothetical protein
MKSILILVLLLGQSAANTGEIVGQILDPSGAAVAGADVTIRNKDTNITRNATTDAAGRYTASYLPLGRYEVTVRASGFETPAQETVVTLGSSVPANFNLTVGGRTESVRVTDTVAGLESSVAAPKSILTDEQLRNLPTPGRRIKNLFLLSPATQIEPECGGFSISGQKGVYVNLTVDGGDYTSSHFCGHVEMSPSVTVEALQEFQVVRSTFSAEFGRSTGGAINLATKSGTNQFHGSAFYLFRDHALTHLDPFGRAQINLGNQLGGSIGGPIKKDRTFFFSAVENQYNTKPVDVLYSQLDLLGLRNTSGAQALISTAPESRLTAMSQLQSVINRVDHQLNDKNTLVGRFDFTHDKITDVIGSFINTNGLGADSVTNRDAQNASPTSNRTNITGMVQLTSIFSAGRVNELRFEAAREYRPWDPGLGAEVTVRDGAPIQTIAIYGPQATGLSYGNVGYKFTDVRTQFVDNYSIATGAHTMKFGVDANLVNSDVVFNPGYNGIYRFDSLASYLSRSPAQYQQFAGTGAVNTHKDQIALYLQDEWRVAPGLTISPGFRYEMAFLPQYKTATIPQNRFPLATKISNDMEMFGPRLGLAWDVFDDHRTMFRAAGGLFYAPPYISLWEEAIASNGGNPEISSSITLNNAAIASTFQQFGMNLANPDLRHLPVFTAAQLNQLSAPDSRIANGTVFGFDPNFRLPRSLQLRTALEQELGNGINASIDYTQIAVSRMDRVRNLNLLPPVTDATGRPIYTNLSLPQNANLRPFPKYAYAYLIESSARSLYRSMVASFNVRRRDYVLTGAYTLGFSKSYDDHENGGFSSANYVDAYNLQNEYNWSNIDQRHQFTANGMFYLPKGFEVSTQMRFNSGRPFSPVVGADLNNDGIVNDRPVFNGNVVRRNTFRNKGFADTSARVQKNFELPSEKGKLAVSAEMFNMFNIANVEIGSAQYTYGPNLNVPSTNPLFGKVKDANGNYIVGGTLRTTPFQVQLGVRLEF